MEMSALFFINSLFLGVGLAMDAFSVSVVNGLSEPRMGLKRALIIPLVFGFFQAFMPMAGWVLTHTMVQSFSVLQKLVPFISLGLLLFIGGKMVAGSSSQEEVCCQCLTAAALVLQGIATSIDALSVGFTIAQYGAFAALVCSLIIAAVTFFICFTGVQLGKRAGCRFSGHAEMLGGLILIAIGIEIFLRNLFA